MNEDKAVAPARDEGLSFGMALSRLRIGQQLQREGWNGKGLWVELQNPDADSKMTMPYIYLNYPEGQRIPWAPSQTDVLASDWRVYVKSAQPEDTWLTRLKAEHAELTDRMFKLDNYLNSGKSGAFGDREKLLRAQFAAMQSYERVLAKRLSQAKDVGVVND